MFFLVFGNKAYGKFMSLQSSNEMQKIKKKNGEMDGIDIRELA
jgi:hypothetical protein